MPHFDYNSADRDILGFLHDVADAAADTLDEIADWSMSGERDGQYSADVVIDDVIVDLLQASGFEVLSEQRFFCSAMLAKEYKATRWQLWNEQYMNYFGASYLLVARKRELPLTPIKPKWQLSPAFAQQVKGVSARQRSD